MENLPLSWLSSAYLFEIRGKKPSIILLILGRGRLGTELVIRTDYKSIVGIISARLFFSPVENSVLVGNRNIVA